MHAWFACLQTAPPPVMAAAAAPLSRPSKGFPFAAMIYSRKKIQKGRLGSGSEGFRGLASSTTPTLTPTFRVWRCKRARPGRHSPCRNGTKQRLFGRRTVRDCSSAAGQRKRFFDDGNPFSATWARRQQGSSGSTAVQDRGRAHQLSGC